MLDDLLGNLPMWQDRALCAQTDPEAFYPEKGGSTREAKRICNRCEVKAECLQYALDHNERFGLWGGLDERERRRLKRRQAAGVNDLGDPASLVQRVNEMANDGVSDPHIGRELAVSVDQVRGLRERHGIPAGRWVRRRSASDPELVVAT